MAETVRKVVLLGVVGCLLFVAAGAGAQPELVPAVKSPVTLRLRVAPQEPADYLRLLQSPDPADRILGLQVPNLDFYAIDPTIITAIFALQADADAGVRLQWMETVMTLHISPAQETQLAAALIAGLKDEEAPVRLAAVKAIGRRYMDRLHARWNDTARPIDPRVVAALREAGKADDPAMRRAVVLAQGEIGDPEAIEPLFTLFTGPDPKVRDTAAIKLSSYTDPRVGDLFAAALENPDADIRQVAAYRLGEKRDPRAVAPLTAMITTETPPPAEAITHLGRFHDPNTVPLLMPLLRKYLTAADVGVLGEIPNHHLASEMPHGESVGLCMLSALEWAGAPAVQPLCELLRDDSRLLRLAAAVGLMYLHDSRALPALTGALQDQDATVRQTAARTLRVFGDVSTMPALINASHDPDPLVRGEAALALGSMQDRRAAPALLDALQDREPDVLYAAAWALARIPDQRVVEPLLALLKGSTDAGIRARAAEALGSQGDRRTVDALIAALADPDDQVRGFACTSLGLLGDRKAVEPLLKLLNDAFQPVEKHDEGVGVLQLHAGHPPAVRPVLNKIRTLGLSPEHFSYEYSGAPSQALLALGMLGDPRAIDPIAKLLPQFPEVDENWLCALSALGAIPDKRAAQALFSALKGTTPDFVVRYNLSCGQVRDVAGPWLVTMLAFPDARKRAQAAACLENMAAPEMHDTQLGNLVGGRKVPGAADALAVLLGDADPDVRLQAGLALAAYNDHRAVTALLHSLREFPKQRYDILKFLIRFPDDPGVLNRLSADVANPDPGIRSEAIYALIKLGPTAIRPVREPLAALLAEKIPLTSAAMETLWQNPRVRSYYLAAVALGMLGDPRALEILLQTSQQSLSQKALLHYTDPRVLQALHDASFFTSAWESVEPLDPRTVARFCRNLEDERADIRRCAAMLLGRLKAKESVPALITLLDDPYGALYSLSVREAAAGALGEIGDRAAVEPLIAHLQTGDVRTRLAMAIALGQLGDPRAVGPIITLMEQIAGSQPREVFFVWLPGDGSNRKALADVLKSLTGQDFGEDAARWKAWLAEERR